MRELARGYADAHLDGLKEKALAQAAAQLKGFSELLSSSEDLRTAFSLPTTPPATRRAIVEDLLGKKAAGPVVSMLAFAAQEGDGSDFPEDVAELAYVAASRSAGMVPLEDMALGRLSARERVSGYARALLAPVHDEKRLSNIEDDLFRFTRIIEGNNELRSALTTNELPTAVRRRVVAELLDRRATSEAGRMATYAVLVGRPRDYTELLGKLVDLVAAEAKRRVADVRSAAEMGQAQRLRLSAALTRLMGSPVDVRVTVEPELLGGFVATVGDTVVDASLRHRVAQARTALFTPTYSAGGAGQSN